MPVTLGGPGHLGSRDMPGGRNISNGQDLGVPLVCDTWVGLVSAPIPPAHRAGKPRPDGGAVLRS
jgi:hypothetical protein